MTRLEIIANSTVEEDIQEALNKVEDQFYFSRINGVHGRGHTDPKQGDAVWPEENFIYIIYADDSLAQELIKAIQGIKEKFTVEGIKIFAVPFIHSIEI